MLSPHKERLLTSRERIEATDVVTLLKAANDSHLDRLDQVLCRAIRDLAIEYGPTDRKRKPDVLVLSAVFNLVTSEKERRRQVLEHAETQFADGTTA